MNVFLSNRVCRKLIVLGNHVVRVTFADAVLCAVCGMLYGTVLGGFGAQARNQLSHSELLSMAGYYAAIGFTIGMAVGFVREVSRGFEIRRRLFERAAQINRGPKSGRFVKQSPRIV